MIVLDTHAWIWFVNDPRQLGALARSACMEAMRRGALYISAISAWEIAMLVAKGRMELTLEVDEWIAQCEAMPFFHFVPADIKILLRSVHLAPTAPKDPADRIILATALTLGFPLVTRDRRIRNSLKIKTIW